MLYRIHAPSHLPYFWTMLGEVEKDCFSTFSFCDLPPLPCISYINGHPRYAPIGIKCHSAV